MSKDELKDVPPFAQGLTERPGALQLHLAVEYGFEGPFVVKKDGDIFGSLTRHNRELSIGVVKDTVWGVLFNHEDRKNGLRFLHDVAKCEAGGKGTFLISLGNEKKYTFEPHIKGGVSRDEWVTIINAKIEEAKAAKAELPSAVKKQKGGGGASAASAFLSPAPGSAPDPPAVPVATGAKRIREDAAGGGGGGASASAAPPPLVLASPASAASDTAPPPEIFISYNCAFDKRSLHTAHFHPGFV